MSKTLRKAIMRRSYLEKKYFLKNTDEYLRACKKQKNYCSGLYKKERETFFNGLNPSLLLIINYFGKRQNCSFLIRKIMELILNWLEKKKFCKMIAKSPKS